MNAPLSSTLLALAGALLLAGCATLQPAGPSRGGSWIGNVPPGEEHYLGRTKSGLDVLAEQDFDILRGKSTGLVVNHTAFDRDNRHIIDVLHEAPGVELVALFGPEHGIRGTEDYFVDDAVDRRTGLPIYSLYGENRAPTADMLEGVDVLVFDMQDVGTRFYTYIGTMALCMEAAAANDVEFVVLDRPNAVGGKRVEGAVVEEDLLGRPIAIRTIATRHGMTIGELALLFNEEFGGIGVDLTVVPMENWRRWMYFDQTGLLWKHPSPAMKTMNGAVLYPGFGPSMSTTLATARGLDRPFEKYGAPYMDGHAVAANLARRDTPGVRFVPVSFTPTAPYHRYQDEECHGVAAILYDRERLDPITAGLHMMQAMYETHPEEYAPIPRFATIIGNEDVWPMLTEQGMRPEDIAETFRPKLLEFKALREQYLLY